MVLVSRPRLLLIPALLAFLLVLAFSVPAHADNQAAQQALEAAGKQQGDKLVRDLDKLTKQYKTAVNSGGRRGRVGAHPKTAQGQSL